ncbi:sigma-54-dependent Fis family transcriptional regulator [Thermodesulfobacteriota bacterium]
MKNERKKLSAWGFEPSKHQPELLKAWQQFTTNGKIEKNIVPAHIAESWIRSRDYNIDPYNISADAYLDGDQYRKLINRNKHLINIASPILKNLFASFGKAYFVVALYDRDGYHLLRLAQPEDLRLREKQGIRMGLRFDEETVGTCGVSLAKRLKKPLRVVGCEHYLSLLHRLSSVYAPIFHPGADDLLGVIAVGGASFIHYPHAESIVVAASTAIENLLELDKAKEELSVYSKSLQLTIDSLDDCIIVVDRNGHVYEMNMPARKLLGLAQADTLNMPVSSLPSCEPLNELIRNTLNAPDPKSGRTECSIGPKTFIVEVKTAYDEWNHVKGVLVQMKDIQDLSRTFQGVTEYQPRYSIENIIGSSKTIGEIKHMVQIAASTEGPVIIEGESGTGKEVVAQAIHNAGNRRNKPFVAINCAAIPLELIEATIFGHEKGAFTGATRTQIGKFELAEGGTVFLDEIADMPEPMQAKMLRAIGERRIERVGGKDPIPIDVRILAATNKNLIEQVQKMNFRQDLFYRLNVFRIVIPPLRERKEDIPDLVYYFINEFAPVLKKRILKVSRNYIDTLSAQYFPGNVRELRNAIQYSMARTDASVLTPAHLKGFFLQEPLGEKMSIKIPQKGERLAEMEKQIILDTLEVCQGNKTKAARMLGIGRATLYRRLSCFD